MYKLFKRVVKVLFILLTLHVASSMAGLDLSELNIIFYTIIVLLIGVFYGIMIVYEMPSPEFMEMIMKEDEDG